VGIREKGKKKPMNKRAAFESSALLAAVVLILSSVLPPLVEVLQSVPKGATDAKP
jgi:hypothetical protein